MLTSDQVKALKNAHSVGILHYPSESTPELIQAFKRVDPGDGFGEQETRVAIPLDGVRFTIYNYESISRDFKNEPRDASASVMSCQVNESWFTFTNVLRAGDELVVEWVGNNNNSLVREAGLTVNECWVRVSRPTAKGKRLVGAFLLDYRVEKCNGIASMIRY